MDENYLKYELEMRIIAFLTFIKIPLNSANSVDLFNTFINKVEKPSYIEEKCTSIEYIAEIHSSIEKYKEEQLLHRFNKDELIKYRPIRKKIKK